MDKKKTVIKKEIVIDGMTIKVIKKGVSTSQLLEAGIITMQDVEMDRRVRAAVSVAKKQAKVCNKPIAKYDKEHKTPYFVDASGERIDLG